MSGPIRPGFLAKPLWISRPTNLVSSCWRVSCKAWAINQLIDKWVNECVGIFGQICMQENCGSHVDGNRATQIEKVLVACHVLSVQHNGWMSPSVLANACTPSPVSRSFPEATVASSLMRWAWGRRSRQSASLATCSMNTSCTGPSYSWCLCPRWSHGKGKFNSGLQWWTSWSISETSAVETWYVQSSWRQCFFWLCLQLFDQDQAIQQMLSSNGI